MAIVFTTGTINAANAGAVGLAMVEKIRDDVVAHPAWELVEEYTPAASLVTWYVFKCLSAVSGLPSDFYVVIGRTIGSGSFQAFICEEYNPATHVVSYYSTSQGGSATVHDASGRATNATYFATLGTNTFFGSPITPRYTVWTPSGVSTKWWITVSEDGFTVAFNGASNGFFHCGAYTPLSDMSNLMPIHMVGADQVGMITRNPALASISAPGYALTSSSTTILGFAGRLDYNDKLQTDQRPVAEQGLVVTNNQPIDRQTMGWALGKLKRWRIGLAGTAPAGIAFGDAYALQGRLWVPYLPSDERMWDTGVAA